MTRVTVVVPMTIRHRGGRSPSIGPDGVPVQAGEGGADVAVARGDPALVKALARGVRCRRMMEEGRYAAISELAAAEWVDRGHLGSLLRPTLLSPSLIEAIFDGVAAEGHRSVSAAGGSARLGRATSPILLPGLTLAAGSAVNPAAGRGTLAACESIHPLHARDCGRPRCGRMHRRTRPLGSHHPPARAIVPPLPPVFALEPSMIHD
jgi:hypothetical protein